MNLRTSLLALGLSLTAASAFATTPVATPATPKPAATAKAKADDTAKHDKQDCTKRNKMGHCEQWAAKPAASSTAPAAKH